MARTYKRKDSRRLTIFWDTETIGFGGEAVASQHCYTYGDDINNDAVLFEGYDCIEQTMFHVKQLWLNLNKPAITLYAHNAAFDLMRIKAQLVDTTFRAVLVAGQLIAGKLEYDGMVIECRDSLRLLPESLDRLSKSLCPELPKLQMNHDLGYEISNPEDQEYAKRDVLTLRKALLNFATLTNIPFQKLKFSAAGQAFALSKTIYEENNQKYQAAPREFNELILKHYYYGGRIYIRHNHNPLQLTNCVSLDITSSYPDQMEKQLFPTPGKLPKKFRAIPSQKGRFFVHVKATNYHNTLPVLPYRTFKPNGETLSTIYPNGTFESYISDTEYYFLKKHQNEDFKRLEVLSCLFWKADDCSQWLKPYIDKFYGLKLKGDTLNKENAGSGDALRTVGKLFLNSVYGKFAQKYVDNGGEQIGWGTDNELLEVFGNSTNDHRNAHISAFITGGARVHLYEAITYYGHENVIYGDTDSVKIPEDVYNTLPKMSGEGDYLGSWKPEGIYTDLQVIAPKVYIGTHTEKGKSKLEIKAKGLPIRGITAVQVGSTLHQFKRSKGSNKSKDINDAIDAKAAIIISNGARELHPITVAYDDKPVKLKTFVKSGILAYKATKRMSYPESVKGMTYNLNVYKIPIVNE